MPPATGPMVTCPVASHSPIDFPSGEQTTCPGVQEPPTGAAGAGAVEPELEPVGGLAAAGAAAAAEAEGDARIVAVPGLAGAAGAAAEGEDEEDPLPEEPPLEAPLPPAAGALGAAAEDPEEPPAGPAAPHLAPVGGLSSLLLVTTDLPGSGNCTSVDSVVVQSEAGILATNISGKVPAARDSRLKSAAWVPLRFTSSSSVETVSGSGTVERLLPPPLTTMGAQFMYISRLPTLLNQVHASAYWPGAMPSGMLYSKVVGSSAPASSPIFPAEDVGHPPSML